MKSSNYHLILVVLFAGLLTVSSACSTTQKKTVQESSQDSDHDQAKKKHGEKEGERGKENVSSSQIKSTDEEEVKNEKN